MTKKITYTDSNSNIVDLREKRKNLVKSHFIKDKELAGTEPYDSIRKTTLAGNKIKVQEIEAKITAYEKVSNLLFHTEFLNDKVQFDELFEVLLQVYNLHNKALVHYLLADSIEQKHNYEQAEKVKEQPAEMVAEKSEVKTKKKKVYHKPRKFNFEE